MTSLSLFASENVWAEQPVDLAPAAVANPLPAKAALAPAALTTATAAITAAVPKSTGHANRAVPHVVLQLPDLSIVEAAAPLEDSPWANRIFWAAIGLGTLLALGLIFTANETSAPHVVDDAPTWTSQANSANGQADASSPPASAPLQTAIKELNVPRPARVQAGDNAAPVGPRYQGQYAGPQAGEGPTLGNGTTGAMPTPPQSPEPGQALAPTTTDGAAPGDVSPQTATPGQASPLGITTPVQP